MDTPRPAPARPWCRHVGDVRIVRTKAANGSWHVRKQCLACRQLFQSALPKRVGWEKLPIVLSIELGEPCQVCGATETEFNHIMPRALAEKYGLNPEEWPGFYLCRPHHMLWHAVVTPGLVPEADRYLKARGEALTESDQ